MPRTTRRRPCYRRRAQSGHHNKRSTSKRRFGGETEQGKQGTGYFANWKFPTLPRFSKLTQKHQDYEFLLESEEKEKAHDKESAATHHRRRRWPTWTTQKKPFNCDDPDTQKKFHWRCLDNYYRRCAPVDLRDQIVKTNEKCKRRPFYAFFHPKCKNLDEILEYQYSQCEYDPSENAPL